jgi:hypothetical protein
VAKKKEKEVPLFRVFFAGTDKLAYLPGEAEGLTLEEATRLSDGLVADTEIHPTFIPEDEE